MLIEPTSNKLSLVILLCSCCQWSVLWCRNGTDVSDRKSISSSIEEEYSHRSLHGAQSVCVAELAFTVALSHMHREKILWI